MPLNQILTSAHCLRVEAWSSFLTRHECWSLMMTCKQSQQKFASLFHASTLFVLKPEEPQHEDSRCIFNLCVDADTCPYPGMFNAFPNLRNLYWTASVGFATIFAPGVIPDLVSSLHVACGFPKSSLRLVIPSQDIPLFPYIRQLEWKRQGSSTTLGQLHQFPHLVSLKALRGCPLNKADVEFCKANGPLPDLHDLQLSRIHATWFTANRHCFQSLTTLNVCLRFTDLYPAMFPETLVELTLHVYGQHGRDVADFPKNFLPRGLLKFVCFNEFDIRSLTYGFLPPNLQSLRGFVRGKIAKPALFPVQTLQVLDSRCFFESREVASQFTALTAMTTCVEFLDKHSKDVVVENVTDVKLSNCFLPDTHDGHQVALSKLMCFFPKMTSLQIFNHRYSDVHFDVVCPELTELRLHVCGISAMRCLPNLKFLACYADVFLKIGRCIPDRIEHVMLMSTYRRATSAIVKVTEKPCMRMLSVLVETDKWLEGSHARAKCTWTMPQNVFQLASELTFQFITKSTDSFQPDAQFLTFHFHC